MVYQFYDFSTSINEKENLIHNMDIYIHTLIYFVYDLQIIQAFLYGSAKMLLCDNQVGRNINTQKPNKDRNLYAISKSE